MSLAAGRRQARRAVLIQAAAAALVALAFLIEGRREALAALAGGGAAVLGSMALAWRTFGGGVPSAGLALGRLLGGIALKWIVVLGALWLALARYALPPLPLVAGLAAVTVSFLLAYKFKA